MTGLQPTSHPRALPRAAAFWTVAALTALLLAASSAPSPLYPVLQAEFGFSSLTLTAIFAVYVLALLVSLLVVGRLSDVVGRRPVLASALVVEAAAMGVFWGAEGTTWLLVARIVQGVATGAAVGVLGAYLLDLQPPDGSRLGSLVNSAAPSFGLAVGAAATGLLVQYGPWPTRFVFALLTGLFAVAVLVVAVLPETVGRVPGVRAALRPEVAVPRAARRAFLGAAPAFAASWALGGLVFSIGGSLLATTIGPVDHASAGLVLGLFALMGAVAAVVSRDLAPAVSSRRGALGLAVGAALMLVAVETGSLAVIVAVALVAGAGFGAAFLGAMRAVTQLAAPHERAALLSAVYVVSYLAFSVPALVSGLLISHLGLVHVAVGYGVLVLLLALVALGAAQAPGPVVMPAAAEPSAPSESPEVARAA